MGSISDNSPLRVLLVEDEWLLGWSIERHLSRQGAAVFFVNNGGDAIRLIETQSFEWLVTDLKLPGKNGFEIVSSARKSNPEIKIILMTAHGSPSIEDKARQLKLFYLTKPFDLSAISGLILPELLPI